MKINVIKTGMMTVGLLAAGVVYGDAYTAATYPVEEAPAMTGAAPPPRAVGPATPAGSAAAAPPRTSQWLQLQASGRAASSVPQQATPREREMSHQRLLDSYGYAIPEFFAQDASGEISR